MATHFSSSRPVRSIFQRKSNSPTSLFSLPGCMDNRNYGTCVNVYKWSSAVNYTRLSKLSCKPVVVKQLVLKRRGVVSCAIIEEIEAEKSLIEKDVKTRMEKTIDMVRTNFNSVRTGRANPAMLDKIESIEKAIVSSDLGMTPKNDGDVIWLSLPQLTSERRKELSKVVAKQAEEGKEKKLSEDNVKDLSNDLQKLTDEYMKKIDSMKEKELLKV